MTKRMAVAGEGRFTNHPRPFEYPNGPTEARMRDAGAYLMEAEKEMAFRYAQELTEVRVTRVGERWRVMMKGNYHGKHLVSYFYDDTYTEALQGVQFFLSKGLLSFKEDEFPPGRKFSPKPK